MKKLIISLFLSLMTITLFSQSSERQQKLSIRGGNYSSGSFNNSSQFRSNYNNEIQQKYSERDYNRPRPTKPGSNVIVGPGFYDPWWDWGWGPNRWGMWGAPALGFSYWSPGFYRDDWGYRQPMRIYHYKDGKKDTIRGKKTPVSFGLQTTTSKEIGGFLTLGNRNYFIIDFGSKNPKNTSVFYPQITTDQVNEWKDERLPNIEEGWSMYMGLGKRFKRTGLHFMLGYVEEDDYFQYFDETYILSNNGNYSLYNFSRNYFSAKLGVVHDMKRVTLKGDFDPFRNNFTFGLGINW
jgi:hypothetical protein